MNFFKRICFFALAVTAGAFLLCGNAFLPVLPSDVKICGVDVGGMSYSAAARLVRENIAASTPSLTVASPDGVYILSYPEISFSDDFYSVAARAKKGKSYSLDVKYWVKDIDVFVNNACSQAEKNASEPYAEFVGGKFTYFDGEEGLVCDRKKLKEDLISSVKGDFHSVKISFRVSRPKEKKEVLKGRTVLLSSFTTYFDGTNENRKNNISLAAKALDGKKIEAGAEFSFNSAVGTRTEKRGFLEANIISGGKYVKGVGGGVCQVSTTLYNAALLSGMKITRVKAHSLAVGYVEPSFDAMVSYYNDFRFVNPSPYPVFISCSAGENFITARIYGAFGGVTYSRTSEITEYIEPEEEIISYGDEEKIVVSARRGLKSVGRIAAFKGDEKLYEREIRRDEYKSVRGERTVKKNNEATMEKCRFGGE